jgi:iron complex transport system substrate-binding protein
VIAREPVACAIALACSALSASLASGIGSGGESGARPEPGLAAPTRIVSLTLPADEILLEIVGPERILALEEFVDDPSASNAVERAGSVPRRIPMVAEDVLAADPDLVILPSWSDPVVGELLAREGIAVHPLGAPASVAEVRAQIRALAGVVAAREHGERLIAEMDARIARVAERGRARASRPSVLLLLFSGHSPAEGTVFCELVEIAGGRCATAGRGLSGYAPLPLELVIELDADVIVTNRYRADARVRELIPDPPLAEDPRFAQLRAVRGGTVRELPGPHLLATSHHVAALAEDLADALDAAERAR